MKDAVSFCAELVREADRDCFIATLFAPAHNRDALYALYAFNVETAHVRDRAREAAPGEIRLQWWRDVLQGERHGEARASPVAASLLNTIERHRLPVNAMLAFLEARRFDLYDEPMQTIAELEDYALKTTSALIAMAARILGVDAAMAAGSAGIACALTQVSAALPGHAARRQLYLPIELLDRHGADAADVFARRRRSTKPRPIYAVWRVATSPPPRTICICCPSRRCPHFFRLHRCAGRSMTWIVPTFSRQS